MTVDHAQVGGAQPCCGEGLGSVQGDAGGGAGQLDVLGHLDATLMRRWPGQPKVRQFHDALYDTRAA